MSSIFSMKYKGQTLLPLLPVTTVGSWPRLPELLRAQRMKRLGLMCEEEFGEIADSSVLDVIRFQEDAGVDVVTDGEQRRDNFYSFVAEKLEGVRLMTLAEMLDFVEDRDGFERILQTLDVPAYAISNPVCVGKIKKRCALAVDDLKFIKKNTCKPVKITLPGPYILTRAMYVQSMAHESYPTKEHLAEDVVEMLREELRDLIHGGADFIQFDEPALTEVVFAQGRTRTFMCASLAAIKDPEEELNFAASLINNVVDGFDGIRIGIHICRGNWSRNEATLLRGEYDPLKKYIDSVNVSQMVLEYATERAGDLIAFDGKEIGLGVVNPRSSIIESLSQIRREIDRALEIYPIDKIWINPDCGFGTFSNRPVNNSKMAVHKIRMMAEAVASYRS